MCITACDDHAAARVPELNTRMQRLCNKLDRRGVSLSVVGLDGSGKTTVTTDLHRMLREANVPVQRIHSYRLLINLFITPWLILTNRYLAKRVLLFDRSVIDNLANFATRHPKIAPAFFSAAGIMGRLYPKMDHRILLCASFDETKKRRPEMTKEWYEAMQENYRRIGSLSHQLVLRTDQHAVLDVVNAIVDQMVGTD